MTGRLAGKVAVVSGGARGMGASHVRALVDEGANVVFGDILDTEGEAVAKDVGGATRYVHLDVTQPDDWQGVVATAVDEFGGVDILVNNAVVRHFAPIEQFKPEDWDRALAVNLSSAFHTTRLVLPGMRQRNFGRIVNISSIFGLRGTVNRVDYVTTKTALIGFTRAVALEVAAQDITCNAICPGSSPTPAIEQRLAEFMKKEGLERDEAVKAFMSSRQPSGRFVQPHKVAGLAAFLCGPDGGDTTGSAISIDGGWNAA
jgi:3-hydroxybutyrate dehydrogenase